MTDTCDTPSTPRVPNTSQTQQTTLITSCTILVVFCILAKFNKKNRLGLTQSIRLSLESLQKHQPNDLPLRIASTLFNDDIDLTKMPVAAILALLTSPQHNTQPNKNKENKENKFSKKTTNTQQKKQGNHIFNNPITVLAEALEFIIDYLQSLPLNPNKKRQCFLAEIKQSIAELDTLATRFEQDCREDFTVDDNDLPCRDSNLVDANAILFGLLSTDLKQTMQLVCKKVGFDNLYLRQAFQLDDLAIKQWHDINSVKASIDKDAFHQFRKDHHKRGQIDAALKIRADYLQQALKILQHVTLIAIDWSTMKIKKPNIFANHRDNKSTKDLLEKLKETQLELSYKKNKEGQGRIVLQQKNVKKSLTLTYSNEGLLIGQHDPQTKEIQQAFSAYLSMKGIPLDQLISDKASRHLIDTQRCFAGGGA